MTVITFSKKISKNFKYLLSFYCRFSFRQLPDVFCYENQNFLSTSTLGNTIYKEWASWNWEPCKGKIQLFNVSLNGKEWLTKSLQMSQTRHGRISRVDYFRKALFFFSYPAKTTCIIVMERITSGLFCWWMTCLKGGFNPDIEQAASTERTCHMNMTRIS